MSVWIQTASAAAKQIRGALPPLMMGLVGVVVVLGVVATGVSAQVQNNPEIAGEVRTLPTADADRIHERNAREAASTLPKSSAKDETCLLPPLNLMSGPTVAAEPQTRSVCHPGTRRISLRSWKPGRTLNDQTQAGSN